MANCRLIIDTCCDLPHEIVEIEGVTLLKFSYEMNGGTFVDDLFVSNDANHFYTEMKNGAMPTTSQLSLQMLVDEFEIAARSGQPTVYLSFSSGLSGSYDAALIAADQVKQDHPDFEIYIIDTKLASIAEGLFVYESLRLFENGATAKELAEWAEEARYFVDCEFMVEDLNTLHRGGRIPASAAVAGTALDVKPLLTIDKDGKLQLIGVSRGRKKGLKAIVDYYMKNVDLDNKSHVVCLGNANCPKDAQKIKELLVKNEDTLLIIESSIGPVIGSHVGPGMVALAFWGKDKRNDRSIFNKITNSIKKG